MKKLIKLEPIVLEALKENEETRGNDYLLVLNVYEKIVPNIELFSFQKLMLNHISLGLPPFESITRCRRKLQKKHNELLPHEKIIKMRQEEEQEYIDYSKLK